MYEIIDRLLPIGRETNRPGTPLTPQGIVLHETANPGATAEAHAAYWVSAYRGSSVHYVVDPEAIIRLIPESEQAWHAGPTANSRYIGIEMCHFDDSAQFEEVWRRTVWLAADICRRYGWAPATAIVTHGWVSQEWHETNHTDPDAYLATYDRTIEQFRREVQAQLAQTAGTPILGPAQATIEQAQAWWDNRPEARRGREKYTGDQVHQIIGAYWQIGAQEGVRPEVSFAQAMKETGWLTFERPNGQLGDVKPSQFNFCGLGATGGGNPGLSFATIEDGARAHLRHLRLYATPPEIGRLLNDRKADPRGLPDDLLGVAPTVEQLGGRWAPAADYGISIVRDYLAPLLATPVPAPPATDPEKEQLRQKVVELQAQVAALTAQVAALQSRIDRARAALE